MNGEESVELDTKILLLLLLLRSKKYQQLTVELRQEGHECDFGTENSLREKNLPNGILILKRTYLNRILAHDGNYNIAIMQHDMG